MADKTIREQVESRMAGLRNNRYRGGCIGKNSQTTSFPGGIDGW
jgi:hypothetical protein